jgi:hypothetical protein
MTPMKNADIQDMRRKIWTAVRGGKEPTKAAALESIFTLAVQGHRLDPAQVADYQALSFLLARQKLDKRSRLEIKALWRKCTDVLDDRGHLDEMRWGPVRRTFEVLRSIGWTWRSPKEMQTRSGLVIRVPPKSENTRQQALHELREALRQRELSKTRHERRTNAKQKAREDFEGVEARTTDFKATRSPYAEMDAWHRGLLVDIQAGAAMTNARAVRHRYHEFSRDPRCSNPACHAARVDETREHVYWDCPRWEHLRSEILKVWRAKALPPCTRVCGIMLEGVDRGEAKAVLQDMVAIESARRELQDEENAQQQAALEEQTDGPPPPPPQQPATAPQPKRRLSGKQNVKKKTPESTAAGSREGATVARRFLDRHPKEQLEKTAERISCSRCGRTARRKDTSKVALFWKVKCVLRGRTDSARTTAVSAASWLKNGKQKAEESIQEVALLHGRDLKWGGEILAPAVCTACGTSYTSRWIIHSKATNSLHVKTQVCTGSREAHIERQKLLEQWADKYMKGNPEAHDVHNYKVVDGFIYCSQCLIFTNTLPKRTKAEEPHALEKRDCGQPMGEPWLRLQKQSGRAGLTEETLLRMLKGERPEEDSPGLMGKSIIERGYGQVRNKRTKFLHTQPVVTPPPPPPTAAARTKRSQKMTVPPLTEKPPTKKQRAASQPAATQ